MENTQQGVVYCGSNGITLGIFEPNMAETPQTGTGSQLSMSETASQPGTGSPEGSVAKTPSVSMSPESVPAATPASQPKAQPPKRRGKGTLETLILY